MTEPRYRVEESGDQANYYIVRDTATGRMMRRYANRTGAAIAAGHWNKHPRPLPVPDDGSQLVGSINYAEQHGRPWRAEWSPETGRSITIYDSPAVAVTFDQLETVLRRLVEMAGPCEEPPLTTNGLPMCYRHRLAWPCLYHEGRRLIEGVTP